MLKIILNFIFLKFNNFIFYLNFYNSQNILFHINKLHTTLTNAIFSQKFNLNFAKVIYNKINSLYLTSKKKQMCTPDICYAFNSSALIMADVENWIMSRKEIILRQNKLRNNEKSKPAEVSVIEPGHIVSTLGHTLNLDALIKSVKLNLIPNQKLVLPITKYFKKRIVNKCLMKYWEQHIDIIYDKKLADHYYSKLANLRVWDNITIPCGRNESIQYHSDVVYIQKLWEDKNLAPLLELSPKHKEEGSKALAKIGITKKDWFVILHVRSDKTKKDNLNILNPDLEDYYDSIKTITDKGGWVIRIGDSSMEKMKKMNNVFDYAHSKIKSDWLDIFLMAEAKFMLGTSSGPSTVSHIFGVPILMTNFSTLTSIYLGKKDILLLKKFYDIKKKKYLDYKSMAKLPYSWALNDMWLKNHFNILTQFNSAEEINLATIEMLESLKNKNLTLTSSQIQNHFRKTFYEAKNFIGFNNLEIQCRISDNFYLKNKELFN